jgi:uncharacterized protein YkwD
LSRASFAFALACACAWPVAAQSPGGVDTAEAARLAIEGTNALRHTQRLDDVRAEPRLTRAAEEFAEYMARTGKYGHEADGRDVTQRAKAQGYDYCLVLENIAYHYDSRDFRTAALAKKVVDGWRDSPLHRRNMLNPRVIHVGVGMARAPNGYYYSVQVFGLPASAGVRFEVRNESRRTIRYQLGDETREVPARSIRTHETCTREPLGFEGLAGGETVTPRAGDRFVIGPKGDRVTLQR